MKISHRIGVDVDKALGQALEDLNISITAVPEISGTTSTTRMIVFDIYEDDPSWDAVQRLLQGHEPSDVADAEFTSSEVREASWCGLFGPQLGYPQPIDTFQTTTYDVSQRCASCRAGVVQTAPFRLKKPTRWERRGLMQLHWVPGEVFVSRGLWSAVFEPAGVSHRPVANRKGNVVDDVVQLVAEEEADVVVDEFERSDCGACGRSRYVQGPGYLPAIDGAAPQCSLFRTRQLFGSGWETYQPLVVSRAIVNALLDSGRTGPAFVPLAGG